MTELKSIKNNAGLTLLELIVSVVISAVVLFAIAGVIIFTTKTLTALGIERGLQTDMNNLARQITDGVRESGLSVNGGLRDASSYAVISPQQVDFNDTTGVTRSFIAANNSLIYSSPTQSPVQKVIYRAPSGSVLNVTFAASMSTNLVGMTISVTQPVNGRSLTGSVATIICLRNAP